MAGRIVLQDADFNAEQVTDDNNSPNLIPEKDKSNENNVQSDSFEKNKLPLSRIKSIIKMDPDVKKASQDAVFILSKATELFIQHLAADAAVKTLSEKRKTITKQHLDHVCYTKDCYSFLEGILESFDT